MGRGAYTVLVLIGSLDVGGTETHISKTLPSLRSERRSFTVMTLSHRGALAPFLVGQGVPVIAPWISADGPFGRWVPGAIRMAAAGIQLLLHLLLQRPRIVHFMLPQSYWLGAPLAIMAGIHAG